MALDIRGVTNLPSEVQNQARVGGAWGWLWCSGIGYLTSAIGLKNAK